MAIPTIVLAALAVGGIFALLAYAVVDRILG
jgi:hypothetical protein